MRSKLLSRFEMGLAVLALAVLASQAIAASEEELIKLVRENRPYAMVPSALFDQLGWELPDGGATVKALADAAPGGAFDPRKLEGLPAAKLGYRAKWVEVRYKVYGLDWEIGGLALTPNQPLAGLPTVAILNGGSANWYEFYVDQFNNPGLGQYLAQKVPVLLMTIPGNYKHGGWTDKPYDARVPAYLLHQEISPQEAKVRNAVYTFRVVLDGVKLLIEKATTGRVVVVGHSTGGELPYLLRLTDLKGRLDGLYLGWGSGGPAAMDKILQGEEEFRRSVIESYGKRPPVERNRPRDPEGYVQSNYIGPLNPCKGPNDLETARCWFRQEERRRPQFKQKLQDLEHSGADVLLEQTKKEIRDALQANPYGVNLEEVFADLFLPNRVPLTGYTKMLWLVGRLDDGHWNKDDPRKALELKTANEFRKRNPTIPIRVAVFDVPITHYAHIERPKQLAAGMVAGLKWLVEK